MRAVRLAVAAGAVAGAFAGVAPASAAHGCVEVRQRQYCVVPHSCVMYPDGSIRCYY